MDSEIERIYTFAFVVEQVLGHITHGENIRRHVPADPEVAPHFVYPPYAVDGWQTHVPGWSNWTLRSGALARWELARLRRHTTLDGVFFHTQVPALLCHDLVRRVPSVISLDATPRQYDALGDVYNHEPGSGFAEAIKHRMAIRSLGAADRIVTWSHWAKRDLVDGYRVAPEKVSVVPPGVDVALWERPPRSPEAGAPTRILFVGGDLERKGGVLLIDVFRSLRETHDVELHLVTRDDVPEETGIRVHRGLSPNSPELIELYGRCDVMALPTFGDCLPMVLAEAGAAGLPCVTTSVAAIPEAVLDGTTGIVVPPKDGPRLHAALESLVVDEAKRRRMGVDAVTHIGQHFDTAKNTAVLLDVMKDASRGSQQGPRTLASERSG